MCRRELQVLIKKMPKVSSLVTTTILNAKIGEVESKIPNTKGLVTTTVLNTKIGEVENKIPNVSILVKKMDFKAKTISSIEGKYFTISDYKKNYGRNTCKYKRKRSVSLIFLIP